MPKIKTHSGASKRFKKTASGYKHKHQHKSHILTKMTTKRKRQLRGTSILSGNGSLGGSTSGGESGSSAAASLGSYNKVSTSSSLSKIEGNIFDIIFLNILNLLSVNNP